jgi:tetratricopeptide (TPR) repeat protein
LNASSLKSTIFLGYHLKSSIINLAVEIGVVDMIGNQYSWLAWGVGISVALVQPVAVAKSAVEVNRIAQAITVKITTANGSIGSGILLQKQGDIYTVLTAAHVVKDSETRFTITTPDDRTYSSITDSVRRYKGDVDLAVLKFRSAGNYKLAELGNSNNLEGGMDLYVAGFPASTAVITESVFVFRNGQVTANSKRVFKNGYALLYSNDTLPGMSGGPVLDGAGKVVGIHGKGDREQETRAKTGFNAGIPIARFADLSQSLGVNIDNNIARTKQDSTLTADDYFVSANQKYNKEDYPGALTDYNQAISLNPNFANAYLNRGLLKNEKLNDLSGALADYNQAIVLNPKLALAYNNRGWLKHEKQNDPNGALADYNQAIALDPKLAMAYNNRGWLTYDKFNDPKGALADYNRAIALNPKLALAYLNRGLLKHEKQNDPQGALADYNQAIALDPKLALAYNNRGWLKDDKLNDPQGAFADYNRAIALNPKLALAYVNRGFLKSEKRNDPQGAFTDYDRAIALDPKFALAYNNRGWLRYTMLNDRPSGIADMRQAVKLARAQGNKRVLQLARQNLKSWGLTE